MNGERLRRALAEAGCDGAVACCAENVTYLTGFASFLAYAFLPGTGLKDVTLAAMRSDGHTALIAPAEALAYLVERPPTADEVFVYGDLVGAVRAVEAAGASPVPDSVRPALAPTGFGSLEAALTELELEGATLAVDEIGLSPSAFRQLDARLTAATLVEGTDVFRRARMVKTDAEVERLASVLAALEDAMAYGFALAAPGITEGELRAEVWRRLVEHNALPGHFETNGGVRAAASFPPAEYALRPGDVVRSDCGARRDGYWADTGRSGVVGEPAAEVEEAYEALRRGMEAMLDVVRPGSCVCDVVEAGIETVRASGLPSYRRDHVGHAIGLELYERPLMAPSERLALEAGMVVNLEVPYALPGVGGLQIEETVVVAASGARLLTTADRDLRRCGVVMAAPERSPNG
jgi:Xaa-Pro dipeptidase